MDARDLLFMEVQTPDGQVHGPLDIHKIRERIYAGRYRGQEKVRTAEGTWRPMVGFAELAEVLGLVGVDVQAMQIRERQQMTGWKKSKAAPEIAPSGADVGVETAIVQAPSVETPARVKLPLPVMIALGAGLVALILALVFLR